MDPAILYHISDNIFNASLKMSVQKPAVLAICVPKIYTVPYVMLLMRANPLRRQLGGGLAWKKKYRLFGPCETAPRFISFSSANRLNLPLQNLYLTTCSSPPPPLPNPNIHNGFGKQWVIHQDQNNA
jgi:hypothetical protein